MDGVVESLQNEYSGGTRCVTRLFEGGDSCMCHRCCQASLDESIVSFAKPPSDRSGVGDDSVPPELTPSEVSTRVTSDSAGAPHADGKSTTTALSLFGDLLTRPPYNNPRHSLHVNLRLPSMATLLSSIKLLIKLLPRQAIIAAMLCHKIPKHNHTFPSSESPGFHFRSSTCSCCKWYPF